MTQTEQEEHLREKMLLYAKMGDQAKKVHDMTIEELTLLKYDVATSLDRILNELKHLDSFDIS